VFFYEIFIEFDMCRDWRERFEEIPATETSARLPTLQAGGPRHVGPDCYSYASGNAMRGTQREVPLRNVVESGNVL